MGCRSIHVYIHMRFVAYVFYIHISRTRNVDCFTTFIINNVLKTFTHKIKIHTNIFFLNELVKDKVYLAKKTDFN